MKRIYLAFIFASVSIFSLNAQNYDTGIGIRGGLFSGITVKYFLEDDNAIEGILETRWSGIALTGLNEYYFDSFELEGLYWYAGYGSHIGIWDGDNVGWSDDNGSEFVLGIDGIIGLEYNFSNVPINISIDWKPAFNLIGGDSFWGDNGGLSLRYVF